MKRPKIWTELLMLILYFFEFAVGESILERIKMDPDLSQFLDLLERSLVANITLQYKQVTIFAPTNSAFQKSKVSQSDPGELALYHIITTLKTTAQVGPSYSAFYTELDENPPIWITRTTGNYHNDIYLNNARLLMNQSDIRTVQKSGNEQILHKIDEVLAPTVLKKSEEHRLYNPTAYELLEYYEFSIINPHRVRFFRRKVRQHNKKEIFKSEHGHTFFIPVDSGFKRADSIDGKIIEGHVIPNRVLFTAPTKKDIPFPTLANYYNDIRVVISFTPSYNSINYVKSHTLLSDETHPQGVVLSGIVKANIPVKNGVVHLIEKPLMVMDNNVRDLLESDALSEILGSFVRGINNADYQEFYNTLQNTRNITLFAPCNSAWTDSIKSVIRDKNRFKEILKMHLVFDRLYVNKRGMPHRVHTLDPQNDLYFNVVYSGTNRSVTVAGGGVNATIVEPDLGANNGVIQIIDRVLGVPQVTVNDKNL